MKENKSFPDMIFIDRNTLNIIAEEMNIKPETLHEGFVKKCGAYFLDGELQKKPGR